jgi:3-hydroxyacyl-CoA dehydrogenase / enoyl-CoA hydratase / 3-hydroxybutyryl-CoA epimerase
VVHPAVLMEAAHKLARRPRRSISVKRSLSEKAIEATPLGRVVIYRKAEKDILKKTGTRYPAPPLALEAIRTGVETSMARGLEIEATNFGRLAVSSTTHNLVDIFIDSNQLKREQAEGGPERPRLDTVGVVGAGLMGAGIGQAAAMSRIAVRLKEVDDQSVAAGLKRVQDLIREAQRSGRLTRYEAARTRNRVSGSTTYSGFTRTNLVIEAATEDLGIKRRIIADLEAAIGPDTIIGTNTSALPIDSVAVEAAHPERIVGIHFFSPVHRMPLVEVVRGPRTSEQAIATAVEFGRKLGKNVIVVKDGPGFYTTRVLGLMMNEAVRVFEEGARIEDVDGTMVQFGFPVGPMTLMDEVGLDVAFHVAETLRASFPDRLAKSKLMEELAKSGRKGKRSGRGFYLYRKAKKTADPGINSLPGRGSRRIGREEIQNRLSLAFVNEAGHCLSEGIVASARDADLAAIFGLGFPPFLGGPFRYVDTEGAGPVVDRLRTLEHRYGPRFSPAESLVEAAERGTTFR